MRPSVLDGFERLSEPIEGKAPHMYLCSAGIVTTAVGVALETVGEALTLPWMLDGRRAGLDVVAADWMRIHARQDLRGTGGLSLRQQAVTRVRLTEGGIRDTVAHALAAAEVACSHRWEDWDTWPADAQLGALSLCWAVGGAGATGRAPRDPARNFVRFAAACEARDWALAGHESRLSEAGNPGVRPRNAAQVILLANAAIVDAERLDPEILHWPTALQPGVRDAPTRPERDDRPILVPSTLGYEDVDTLTDPEIRLDHLETEPPPKGDA